MRTNQLFIVGLFIFIFGVLVFNDVSFASSTGDMPYEKGLSKVRDSLTGPIGTSIGVIALFASAAMFIFGAELSGVIKGLVGVCFAIGVMLSGNKIMSTFFSASGNMIIINKTEILSDKISKPDIGFTYEQDI